MSKSPPIGPIGELPNWVFDVVTAIDTYEHEHPSTLIAHVQSANDQLAVVDHRPNSSDYGGWDWCIKHIQDLIPREVHEVADHIRRYQQDLSAGTEVSTSAPTEVST